MNDSTTAAVEQAAGRAAAVLPEPQGGASPAAPGAAPPAPGPVDLADPGWLRHPREMARQLHARGRVHRGSRGLWLLTGHAECRAVMQSAHLSRDPRRASSWAATRPFGAGSALEQAAERFMLFNDPPVHARLRRVVSAAFTPAAVRGLRASIASACDQLLGSLPDDQPFDFMRSFAQTLPVRVICDLLGLDSGDLEQAKAWSDAIACVVEPLASRAERAAAAQAVEALCARLREQVAHRRASPGGTVLDLMIQAQAQAQVQDGRPGLDDDELLANLVLLFIAGHETTTNLLGNGLLALLEHPAQMARLRADLALLPGAVEEMLRWESPVNMVARITLGDWSLGGLELPAGEVLYCMVGAAHQDPSVFDEPERFDIARRHNPQLAFGGGVHYCVGAPLARLEAEVAFAAVLRRWPALRGLDPAPRWRAAINVRGLQSLRVEPLGKGAAGT